MIDNVTALDARDDMLWVADHWHDLRNNLRPGGGNALTGMPGGTDEQMPINVAVSDLMHAITEQTRFYAHMLMDETDWTPSTSSMPTLLSEVARRYGHFTASGDDQIGLEFCDDAHEWRRKVRNTLYRPDPAEYVGPCRVSGCGGELYLRKGKDGGECHECGTTWTLADQREYLADELEARLMTASEITSALVVIGHPVPFKTVTSWIDRGRLMSAGDKMYRLTDALDLARLSERRRTKV